MGLKRIIEHTDTRAGQWFDAIIQSLIVISLINFALETLPDLSWRLQTVLRVVEVVTIGTFTIEYLCRLFVSDRKLRFAFSFFGMVDLLAILPFYLSTGLDLRAVRVFRLLRAARALKMARYGAAIQRMKLAMAMVREEFVLFFSVSAILLFLSATGIYYFENQAQPEVFRSIFDGMWWAISTLTTVGYGDAYPVTVGGKIFTFMVLVIGLGIVAVPSGLIASALSQTRMEEAEKKRTRDPD